MSSSTTDVLVDVLLPAMGTSISEGTLIGWSKAIGDEVAEDETICEVSTDKVDTECPSPATGVLAEILVEVGETVDVGTAIARLAVRDGAVTATSTADPDPGATVSPAPSVADPRHEPRRQQPDGRTRRYSPVVTRMAEVHDLDLDRVEGSGRNGRVTKKDVLAFLDREPEERPMHSESPYRPDPVSVPAPTPSTVVAAPSPGNAVVASSAGTATPPTDLGGRSEPLSRMRQAIGAAMVRSQATAATCHTVVECDMSRVEARRRELGITALPLVARAVLDTLREFPNLNATLDGTTVTSYERVHLGIAVSLGDDGLIVPVIHDAHELAPEGISRRVKDVARRARVKQLQPDEVLGATFTITNPGAAGAVLATPIINVPQVAILDLEAIVRRPIVVIDAEGNESIAIRPMVNLILGWDHRAIDGIYAARFLTALRARIEGLP